MKLNNTNYFSNWVKPHVELAKRRGVKLTPNNLKKLESAYLSRLYEENGFNGMLFGVYAEHIKDLIESHDGGLIGLIAKDNIWNQGVILKIPEPTPTARYFTWIPYNDYGFIDHKPELDKMPILWYSSIYGKEEQDSCRDRMSRNSSFKSARRTRDDRHKADLIYHYLGSKRIDG